MTMTDPGSAGRPPGSGAVPPTPPPAYPAPPPFHRPGPQRWLRRSRSDRMISGVAGGLGEYFGVDPVIFRVLFAVLSFFGGVGLVMYGLAWLLVPEPEVGTSALDKAIGQLRVRRVPPWLVLIGGAIVLWIGWFSWWSPGPTFPAIMLLALLMLVLIRRLERGDAPAGGGATTPGAAETVAAQAYGEPGSPENPTLEWSPPATGEPGAASGTDGAPLIAPLNDTRRSMQAWLAEAGAAHRERVRRRRPIKAGVAVSLAIAWTVVALLDGFRRVPFPAYLWVGLAVLGTGLLVSVVTRRLTLSLLVPIAVLTLVTFALGGTRTSLTDGSGQQAWIATTAEQLGDHRLFAGQATLDLTGLSSVPAARSVHLSQAAGEVRVLLPAGLNATVIADVHLGEIQNGRDYNTAQRVNGMNVHSELRPADHDLRDPVRRARTGGARRQLNAVAVPQSLSGHWSRVPCPPRRLRQS
jgi:phage shock protein PspC (stress-responsive transcriptional regulator)